MKTRITLAASVLALLSLTGCASQSQIEEQNKQLAAINVTLAKIQANQAEAFALQKIQTNIQMDTHNLQVQQQPKSK
jgi:murein lipoprotein